ncbi:MAG: hypothetical protein R3Y50_10635 [Rikenellaceae bacterium]
MDRRVEFNTVTKFELSKEELTHLYTLMSLVQFPYDCDPTYREDALIRRLCNEFNRFNIEITKACENDPNNLVLSQIRNYIQRHYGFLKRINKEHKQE